MTRRIDFKKIRIINLSPTINNLSRGLVETQSSIDKTQILCFRMKRKKAVSE